MTNFFAKFSARRIPSPAFQTDGERKPSPILMGEGRVRVALTLRLRRHNLPQPMGFAMRS
jgi:hypothetical protein